MTVMTMQMAMEIVMMAIELVMIDGDSKNENNEESVTKSADNLFRILILDYAKYQEKEPLKGVRSNKMYTILKSKFDDVCAYDNGAYKTSRTTKQLFYLKIDRSKNTILSKSVHLHNGHFYYNVRGAGNKYERVGVNKCDVWMLHRYYRASKSIPRLESIKAYDSELCEPHICVIYSNEKAHASTASEDEIQSRGNSNHQNRPYIRTKSTLSKQKELLKKYPGKKLLNVIRKYYFLYEKMELRFRFWYNSQNVFILKGWSKIDFFRNQILNKPSTVTHYYKFKF